MNQLPRLSTLDFPAMLAGLHRNAVGFDRMFDELHHTMHLSNLDKYPPHDIVKLSDISYTVNIAVAGFREEELNVTVENNVLTITGTQEAREEKEYLHRGISARAFTRTFNLAEHAVVQRAKYENGLLIIDIEIEIPEELKPRKVEIQSIKQSKKAE